MSKSSRALSAFLPIPVLCLFMIAALPATAEAQGFLKKLEDTAKEAVEEETLGGVDMLIRGKIKCVFTDLVCMENAAAAGEEVVLTDDDGEVLVDEEGQPVSDPDKANEMMGAGGGAPDLSTMNTGATPGLGEANANYDFQRGTRVLYEDDYTGDNVGDFPRRMNLIQGNWDVVEWNGQRWLRNVGPRHAAIEIPLPETLPDQFTIEFDAYFPHTNQRMVIGTMVPSGNYAKLSGNAFQVGVQGGRTGVISPRRGAHVESLGNSPEVADGPTPIRIMVDGQYAKMYVGTRRVANIPNAQFERTDRLYFSNIYFADEENPMLVGPLRVAAGGRDLYDVLTTEGRFTARGILFDVNSTNIRGESAPVLEEIGTTLRDHPDLRLSIEGHTDADGDDAHNQTLSEGRAAAVRDHLIANYGIDEGRLQSRGFGESAPVAPNDTEDGKQQNRRVELVRI